MSSSISNLRGIGLMVLSTGAFACNDTLIKLATAGIPPLEVTFLRGIAAAIWCLPLVFLTGNGLHFAKGFDRWVLLRALFEFLAVVCFVFALAKMPIADITALAQVSPTLVLLGVSVLFGDKIGPLRMGLIALGFAGALLVAQPTGSGFTPYAILGILQAFASAARDIVGRRVPGNIPGVVVAYSTIIVVLLGSGLSMGFAAPWVMPAGHHLLLIGGAGFFLTLGHLFLFLSFRAGATAAVAPFYYMFTVWAVISGLAVFGTMPNGLAWAGIALILGSGVLIVLLDQRRRRLTITA